MPFRTQTPTHPFTHAHKVNKLKLSNRLKIGRCKACSGRIWVVSLVNVVGIGNRLSTFILVLGVVGVAEIVLCYWKYSYTHAHKRSHFLSYFSFVLPASLCSSLSCSRVDHFEYVSTLEEKLKEVEVNLLPSILQLTTDAASPIPCTLFVPSKYLTYFISCIAFTPSAPPFLPTLHIFPKLCYLLFRMLTLFLLLPVSPLQTLPLLQIQLHTTSRLV